MENHAPPSRNHLIADFICTLQTALSTVSLGQPLLDANTIATLDLKISQDPFKYHWPVDQDFKRIDAVGTSLWNTCSQLILTRGHNPADVQILAKVRTIAFAILNSIVPSKVSGWIRSLTLALIAAQTCLATEQFDTAHHIIIVATQRLHKAQSSCYGLQSTMVAILAFKYWMFRVRLAAARDRLDVAEYFWTKVPKPNSIPDCRMSLETCLLIGESVMRSDPSSGLQWLHRANENLQYMNIATEMRVPEYGNWSLVLDHTIAATCGLIDSPEARALLAEKLNKMKVTHPGHPAVVLFEHSLMNPLPDANGTLLAFQNTVVQMEIMDANMEPIFSFLRFLGQQNNLVGEEAMDTLLHVPLPTREWTEKCLIAYVVILTRSKASDSIQISCFQGVIEALKDRGYPSVSGNAAQAIVICLWKLSGKGVLRNDYKSAVAWLHFCTDPMFFTACNDETKISIQMKLVACYLQSGKFVAARELLDRSMIQSRLDCKGMYLSFKLALGEGKNPTNYFALGFPKKPLLHKQVSLLACAIEAQRLRKLAELLSCLKQLILCSETNDIFHVDFSAPEHHMFLISLMLKELEDHCSDEFYRLLSNVLDDAVMYAKNNHSFEGGGFNVSVNQVRWLYHTCCVVGLELAWHQKLPLLVHAMTCSQEFIVLYRQMAGTEYSNGPRPYLFAITYTLIIAYADEARRETNLVKRRSHYQSLRQYFETLQTLRGWEDGEEEPTPMSVGHENRAHNKAKFFNFEATLRLGLWTEVLEICKDDARFPDAHDYAKMFDMVLQVNAPKNVTLNVLKQKRIVCGIILKLDGSPRDFSSWRMRLPRYLRLLFDLASENVPDTRYIGTHINRMIDQRLAEEILERIYQMARTEHEKEDDTDSDIINNTLINGTETWYINGKNPFPPSELKHVALLAFNKAAEFFGRAEDEECFAWGERALDIAGLIPGSDGEDLVRLLEEQSMHFSSEL